jgi:type 1 glutamine amidotransferase
MKKITLVSVLLFSIVTFSTKAQSSVEGKNILIVYGGWQGHQPEVFAKKIASWLEEQNANVTLSQSTSSYTDTALMESVDLIIQHITMSKMKGRESAGLRKAIASGVGLAGCHGGLGDSFRDDTEYQYMIGGQFVKHPGGQMQYGVTISDTADPITSGIGDFKLKTEQYYMHIDPMIEILATTKFSGEHDPWIEGVEMPVVWKKKYGKGKVFYSALGHSEDVFEIPEAWALMTRGIEWATK